MMLGDPDWAQDCWDPDLVDEDDLAESEELDGLILENLALGKPSQEPGAELALMTDAGVIETAVACRAAASQAQGRMYRALQELERRRPPLKRNRRGEDVRERRDMAEGMDNTPVQRVPVMASAEVQSEIALAFTATEYAAGKMAETSEYLWSRLPRLHLELEAGRTDNDRVKVLTEGTQDLSDEDAGKVDGMLSERSSSMTTGELREAVKRAVIRIDPEAADKRRERSEKKARASLYGNRSGTATLALEDIPAAQGAAAKARINAISRAAKSAGAKEELATLEAKIALGLLLGTLSLIPPASRPGDPGDPGDPPAPGGGSDPGGGSGDEGRGDGDGGDGGSGPTPEDLAPGDWSGVAGSAPGYRHAGEDFGTDAEPVAEQPAAESAGKPEPPGESLPWPSIPDASDAAAPGCATTPAGLTPKRQGRIKLLVPWRTVAGMVSEPGDLSWFGPVTPAVARDLARAAAADKGARWSLIITNDDGRALAFAVLRHPREAKVPGLVGEVTLTISASLAAALNHSDEAHDGDHARDHDGTRDDDHARDLACRLLAGLDPAVAALLREAIAVADKAAVEAELRAMTDEAAGGCAHTQESGAYRVPDTMRRWLAARDRMCRNPICRQRAAQCDWDHTVAFDKGGRTCPCDLGAVCRRHHRLKQMPGWHVEQDGQGRFTWTTPAGLIYRREPFTYLV